MTDPNELPRMVDADGARRRAELERIETHILNRAAADVEGWRKCIARAIELKRFGFILLTDRMTEDESREKAPFVDVTMNRSFDYLNLVKYAAELQRLLGEPFRVEARYDESQDKRFPGLMSLCVGW